MSIISLLTNQGQNANGIANGIATGKSGNAGAGANSAGGGNGAVQSFQAALNGFMSGNVNAATLPTNADGSVNLNAMQTMNPEQLAAILAEQGITPDMLVAAANQLQTTGSASSTGSAGSTGTISILSSEQLAFINALSGNTLFPNDLSTAIAGQTAEAAAAGQTGQTILAGQSAQTIQNPQAVANITGNNSTGTDGTEETAGPLSKAEINAIANSLKQLAKVLTKGSEAKPANAASVVLSANEINSAASIVENGSTQQASGVQPNGGLIAPVQTPKGNSDPIAPQNIANTLLNAGNSAPTNADNRPNHAAGTASNGAHEMVAAGKEGALKNLQNFGGNGNSNNANKNGQNASQQFGNSNPLLNKLKAGGLGLNIMQQNGINTAAEAMLTADVNATAAAMKTANAAPQAMQPQALQTASIFDAVLSSDTGSQSTTSQNGQVTSNSVSNMDGQNNSLAKDITKATRPLPTHQQSVTHNVGMQVSRAVANGQTDFTIRIDPPELGRVNVKIAFGNEGSIRAMVTVDTREALNLLQRDAHVLERALGELGSKLDHDSLNFSLKDQNNDAGNEELLAKNNEGNGAEFEAALDDGEDIMNDILPFIDASRALDIRI